MRFRIKDLPEWTKLFYDMQSDRRNVFKITLANQKPIIEGMLLKLNIYSVWTNMLLKNPVAGQLIPEIFIDSNSSMLFGCFGLFKYAYMCMRSELETALRLIFFRHHPKEFKWWLDGKIWWPGARQSSHVWGVNYSYFQNLEKIDMFDEACPEHLTLFKKKKNIYNSYKLLSNSIHSSAKHFQTSSDQLSTSYDIGKFNQWVRTWERIESQVNILLSLGFFEELNSKSDDTYTSIKRSIDPDYHDPLDSIFLLGDE